MDCGYKYELLFSFCLVIFAGLQWICVSRQNAYNLFKLRMEHFNKFNSLILDIHKIAKKDTDKRIISNEKYLTKLIEDFYYLRNETIFLFDKQVSDSEQKIYKKFSEIAYKVKISNCTCDISKDLKEIDEIKESSTEYFIKFLKRLK